MNTKKNKNKQKQHKPPTPQPKQEVSGTATETCEPTDNPVELVKPECIKSEERVPEIVSEQVQPSLESKLSESDAPKKPKRNRSKKKKTDNSDDTEQIADEPALEERNVIEPNELQSSNITEGKPQDIPELTPIARKKKNKNKKHSEQSEKQGEHDVKVTPIKKGEELTDLKIVTVVPVVTETHEESKSKKKNKKKKRNDSERSDRAEEILSCTAAFQKILESKDDKKEVKKENVAVVEDKNILNVENQALSDKNTVSTDKDTLAPTSTKRDKSSDSRHESKAEGGKGKKKNKKDKKHPPKEESEDETSKPLQTKLEIDSEGQTVTVPSDANIYTEKESQKQSSECQLGVEQKSEIQLPNKDKSPKPKAKIAKPVEKKQKGKQDVSSTENLSEIVSENVLIEKKPKTLESTSAKPVELTEKEIIDSSTKESDIKETTIAHIDVPISQSKEEKHDTQTTSEPKVGSSAMIKATEVAQDTTKMKVPECGTGKKRNKSPKPKPNKTTETTDQPIVEESASQNTSETKVGSKIQQDTQLQQDVKEAKQVSETQELKMVPSKINEPTASTTESLTSQESEPTNVMEIKVTSEIQEIPKQIKEPNKIEDVVASEKLTEKETMQVLETNSRKKRKKSPRPQKKSEKPDTFIESASSSADLTSSTKEPVDQSKISNVGSSEPSTATIDTSKDKPQGQQMTDSLVDLPVLEDIEIRSVKAEESEGSVCDITPDIHYPRASSQLLDNNNNTVIRDVTATDVKLNIPIVLPETPLSQGSVETPLPVKERSHPGVTITEISTTTKDEKDTPSKSTEEVSTFKSDEKTDLKSKVLDVNQGMEELRRSIERSLAELSSMEKSEKEAEDQFFKAQAKLEQITEMASKKSEEKKQGVQIEQASQTLSKSTEIQKAPVIEKVATTESKQSEKKELEITKSSTKNEEKLNEPTTLQQPVIVKDINIEEPKRSENIVPLETQSAPTPPVPARKDNKGKGKKKKGKQELESMPASTTSGQSGTVSTTTTAATSDTKGRTEESKKDEKSEQKSDNAQGKGKQQSASMEEENKNEDVMKNSLTESVKTDFETIESFEDALFANVDENEQDVNKNFEIIVNEVTKCDESQNPKINVTGPVEDDETVDDKKSQEKVNPLSQPKNLLGHPDIPARLNRTDYKKEKNKHQTPNTKQATVKIKDAVPIEVSKESKESQTENKRRFLKDKTVTESITSITSENEEYIYKYSFRKVFLPSACHVCKKELKAIRVPCNFCNLIFYCSLKHKDEDYSQHQGLCFAVSTIVHLRDLKHIYADAKNITGHEYRLLRMQMIVSCEKVLKRRLVPWEQEALLYPRMCADTSCREWRHNKLTDCEGCGQISYCSDDPNHLPKSHQRWCKSYSLYNKLVVYQQTKGRLEPRLPSRVMAELYQIPGKLNEVLASMYEEKIDMTDIQYAALTQIATAPLTAAYCHQLYNNNMNAIYANGMIKKSSFTIHVVGAELQFEADALNKWEVFFLHLRPDVKDLRVVLIGPDLNPSKLPLDLLSKIKLCENCHQNKRRVLFDFQDKKTYNEYWSTDFATPDLVCAFNPSIQRSSVFNGKDTWPSTIKCILRLRVPFVITSYTMSELQNDLTRIKECSEVEVNTISEAEFNAFASVRPDRNFISDDEMPLLFKNYCFATVCGAF